MLSLDADERISPELRANLLALFRAGDPSCDGYTMPRRAYHLGRWIRGGGWYPDRKLRLFRRGAGRFGGRDPHDKVMLQGTVGELDGDILHYAYRDLAHHERKMEGYTSAAAHTRVPGRAPLRDAAHVALASAALLQVVRAAGRLP